MRKKLSTQSYLAPIQEVSGINTRLDAPVNWCVRCLFDERTKCSNGESLYYESHEGSKVIPIFEQGGGRGIGLSRDRFESRFEEICSESADKTLAFIFYDFTDRSFKAILKDQGVFAKLDRLSGANLSIFFFHGGRKATSHFNSTFREKLGIEDPGLPSVIFFRWNEGVFVDIAVVTLSQNDLIHGFMELYEVISARLKQEPVSVKKFRAVRYLQSASRFLLLETAKDFLKLLFDHMPFLHR